MGRLTRRNLMVLFGAGGLAITKSVGTISILTAVDGSASAQTEQPNAISVEDWMDRWMSASRAPAGTLHLSRFKDPIYFLTKPISWIPNSDQTQYQAVDVPVGFVTDFASIPRVFWSLLRPDGEYTYPAIIHDFMYWTQDRPREVADEIFRFGMKDFNIDRLTITTIYQAVRTGGNSAWESNARLKSQGERRILKEFPKDPRISWPDWKIRPDVFAP